MKLKDDLLKLGINLTSLFKRKVENGRNTSFWKDNWLGGSPLCVMFPYLYRLDSNPNCKVNERSPTVVVPNSGFTQVSSSISSPMGFIPPPGLRFQWAWTRELLNSREFEDLSNLTALLSQLSLSTEEDSWEFIVG